MKMPFGKYKGQDVKELPLPYVEWVIENVDEIDDLLYMALQSRALMGGGSSNGHDEHGEEDDYDFKESFDELKF